MTREEAIAKADAFLDEDIALIVHDNEQAIASRGATEEERARISAHNEAAMREFRERMIEIIDSLVHRDGQELN